MRRTVTSVAAVSTAFVLAAALIAGLRHSDNGHDTLGLAASTPRQVDLHVWDTGDALRHGRLTGAVVRDGRILLTRPTGKRFLAGRRYDAATWTSNWRTPGFAFTQLVASWSARTPGDSFVEVLVRGRSASHATTSWDTLARWANTDKHVLRTSLKPQPDDGTTVDVDTWKTRGLAGYQLQVRLMRRTGTHVTPDVDLVGAMASRLPATAGATSQPGPGAGVVLPVPRYSQMLHRGEFPQWGGGGEAWCSPTSTSMVLGYYGKLPRPRSYAWVPTSYADRWVDFSARATYDHAYDGTGNWPFNTAYAAPRVGKAFVTRLRSLREAGRFIAARIPLVVSIAFGPGELSGAPISSTHGHLVVIAGFTRSGDVVVNDPAASTDRGVRRTYDRGQFERAWLNGSGGTAYVIRDAAHPLPAHDPGNW